MNGADITETDMTQNIHITWGPEGEKLSVEEKQAIAADLLRDANERREAHDQAVKALEGMPYIAVPIEQLADIYARFKRLTRLGQRSLDTHDQLSPEVHALKRAIFNEADFGAVFAGQWLPKDERAKVIEELRSSAEASTQAEEK